MKLRDVALAVLISVVWGLAFIAAKVALQSFTAPQLTALRFLLACLPMAVVPRPKLPWSALLLIGLFLFTGQFLLFFLAMENGMPPGLASVTQQVQAFITVLLATIFLGDHPLPRHWVGMGVAFAGLVLIGVTIGVDVSMTGFVLALLAATSWSIGNILVKRTTKIEMFPLVVWASIVPPLPALLLSWLYDDRGIVSAVGAASWSSLAAVVYLGSVGTVFAYAGWGSLLRRYPAGVVAPFALLVPCTGVVASALILGETFSPVRYAGMALILCGLLVIAVPSLRVFTWRPLGQR